MTNTNPIVGTPEFELLVAQYKENLNKYQPGNWYFGRIEKGLNWDDSHMSIEELKAVVSKVSPIGTPVNVDDVVDVTPTYEELNKMFPGEFGYDYNLYSNWLCEQIDVFYYGRGREDFSRWEAFKIAAQLGYKKVIMEDFS